MENKKKKKQKKEPMDKQDIICYLGAFIFFILALLPYLLRTFDLNYDPAGREKENKKEPSIEEKSLSCNKVIRDAGDGVSYSIEIVNKYEKNVVKNSTIRYIVTISDNSELTFDDVVIEDYKTITSINSKAMTYGEDDKNKNTYIIRIDYNLDSSLRQNQFLSRHNQNFDNQKNKYETDGYACTTNKPE